MSVDAPARVVGVRPLLWGGYGVTLTDGDGDYYYLIADDAPRLGAAGRVMGYVDEEKHLSSEARWMRVSGEFVVDRSVRPERMVPAEWRERAELVWGRPLFDYQKEGAAWIAARLAKGEGAILADEPGLGKSAQAFSAVLASEALPCLIICPLTLKAEWLAEIGHAKQPIEVQVLSGNQGLVYPAHVYIANYDIMKAREKQISFLGCRSVIFDEAHVLKEPRAPYGHRASTATRIAHRIGRSVVLSGTPLLNHTEEYWRLLHIVAPDEWPDFESYAERYCHLPTEDELREDPSTQKRIVTAYGRAERAEELQVRVDQVLLRRTKEDVKEDLPAMPDKSRRLIEVDLEPEDMAYYEATRDAFRDWYLEVKHKTAVPEHEALQRIGVLRQIAAIGKMRRAVPEYIRAWFGSASVRPLVVFGYHRQPLAMLESVAGRLGLRAGVIRTDGPNCDEESRQKVVDAFRAGETDLLLAPILAAGLGLNLQTASDALFIETTWVPAQLEQAEMRLHRIGQTRPVEITYLAARGTIDEHMRGVVEGKQVLISELIDRASSQ